MHRCEPGLELGGLLPNHQCLNIFPHYLQEQAQQQALRIVRRKAPGYGFR